MLFRQASDLPTHLVAAFKATLEEVVEADLILHVRDIAHPETAVQAEDVASVLGQLGVDASAPDRVIEVWNKIDLLPDRTDPSQPGTTASGVETIGISALTGEGLPQLLDLIETHLNAGRDVYVVELSGSQLADLHYLYEVGEVLDRADKPDGATSVRVRVAGRSMDDFHARFPQALRPAPVRAA